MKAKRIRPMTISRKQAQAASHAMRPIGKSVETAGFCGLTALLVLASAGQSMAQNPLLKTRIKANPEVLAILANSRTVSQNLPDARFDATRSQLLRRPAIAFKPLTLADLAPGKSLTPDMTGKLSNGKQITLSEYLRQRNLFEQQLNAMGYSARTPGAEFILQEPVMGKDALIKQSADFKSHIIQKAHVAYGPEAIQKDLLLRFDNKPDIKTNLVNNLIIDPAAIQTLTAESATPIKITNSGVIGTPARLNSLTQKPAINPIRSRQVPVGTVKPVLSGNAILASSLKVPTHIYAPLFVQNTPTIPLTDHRFWNYGWGNDYFGAYYNGTLDISGKAVKPANANQPGNNLSEFHTATQGKIGVRLLTASTDVLKYTGNYDGSNVTRTVHIGGSVYVAGFKVWSDDRTFPTHTETGTLWDMPFDVHTPDNLQIPIWGPFYVSGQIGVAGKAGVGYSYSLYASWLSGSLNPYFQSHVYAHGGVGAGFGGVDVAEVGLSANMTLLNENMEIGANVGVGWLNKFYLQDQVYCYNKVDVLQGHVEAYAQLLAVDVGPVHINGPRYTHTLFDWDGFHADGYLFDITHITSLDW